MSYSNSPLVGSHIYRSPNHSGRRVYPITRISIHCVVGQCTVETLGNIFKNTSLEASSNYGIGKDGTIGMFVDEENRSWCTSSYDNDQRAVTIEVASDTYDPYRVTDAAYKSLVKLVADIAKRNGKKKVLWFGDRSKTLNYKPASDEIVLTVHRWFANKSCPGDYLYNLHTQIAKEATALIAGGGAISSPSSTSASKNQNGSSIRGANKVTLTFDCLAQSGYTNSGNQVKTLQRMLNVLSCRGINGGSLTVDGIFGANTDHAVKIFQKAKGLTVDGIVGKNTWKALLGCN